ncbi:hypothetical protein P3L10_019998 [Capsicum annuum]
MSSVDLNWSFNKKSDSQYHLASHLRARCSRNQNMRFHISKGMAPYILSLERTYQEPDCIAKSTRCLVKSKSYICTRGQCLYNVKYEDGSSTRGWIAAEEITFVLDQNSEKILFGCGKDQMRETHYFSGDYSGIADFGRRVLSGGYSLPSQFEADIMAMCLPGTYSIKGSTLSFHKTSFEKKTSAKLLPNFEYTHIYFINLYKVFINDKEIPLNPSIWNFRNDKFGGCMVDTGTIVTRFPRDFYNVFRDTFRQEVVEIPLFGTFDTCYIEDPGFVPNFPIVKKYLGHRDPNNLLLLKQQRVVVHTRGCSVWLLFHGTMASHL